MVLMPYNPQISGGLLNIQSVTDKTIAIKEFISEKNLDFLVLTETWLNGDVTDRPKIKDMTPQSHKYVHKPRKTRGGGVGVLLSKAFKNVTVNETPAFTTFEILDITGYISNRKLRIVSVYRPPRTNVARFFDELERFLNTQLDDVLWTIVCGDFNLWVELPNRPSTRKFLDLVNIFNMKNNVNVPTARSGHTLDLVITDDSSNLISNIEAEEFGSLFHYAVTYDVNILRRTNIEKEITFRNKKIFDPINFIDTSCAELLGAADHPCQCSPVPRLKKDCINCLCSEYNTIFSRNFDTLCPTKTKKINLVKDPPWYNNEIKEARKERRLKELRWRRNKTNERRLEFNASRNKVCRLIQQAKSKYYNDKIEEFSSDSAKLNGLLSDLTGEDKEVILPASDNDKLLADNFGIFFDQKIDKIVNQLNLPDDAAGSVNDGHPQLHPPERLQSFTPITEAEMKKIMSNAKPSFNICDPFPISLVKDAPNFDKLVKIFTMMNNLSWETNCFPDTEKTGIIKPLYKGEGNANDLKFYRPVTTLSFLSKVMEKAMLLQLHEFLQTNNILPDMQSAYRPLHSTESTVCSITDDLLLNMDKGKGTILFLLDLSAAFDTVDHSILLNDLKDIGLGENIVKWFTTYLKDRKFKVQIKNTYSNARGLNRGVPQGSVAGPILFLIYTRGLSNLLMQNNITHKLFADDAQGWHLIRDLPMTCLKLSTSY